MKNILVIGASGFVGKHLARGLLADGYNVRCVARTPGKVEDLAREGCEIFQGDLSDAASIDRALESMDAVYITTHTLSPQHAGAAGQDFMDVEMRGLQNVVAAAGPRGTRRIVYITSLGVAPDGPGAWVRGRWKTEQFLLHSGLDVTVIRPGLIVGIGGRGFGMAVAQAKKSVAVVMGRGGKKMSSIAIDDLVYYLTGVLTDPRAFGQAYEVGCDEVFTTDRNIDIAAEVLGRPHPFKIHIPLAFLRPLAPLLERRMKSPDGALKGALEGMDADMTGNPMPIRQILPRIPLSYRNAVQKALIQGENQ